jgi:hypothetical protein
MIVHKAPREKRDLTLVKGVTQQLEKSKAVGITLKQDLPPVALENHVIVA